MATTAMNKKRDTMDESKAAQIRAYAKTHPETATREVAESLGTSYNLVYETLNKISRTENAKAKAKVRTKVKAKVKAKVTKVSKRAAR